MYYFLLTCPSIISIRLANSDIQLVDLMKLIISRAQYRCAGRPAINLLTYSNAVLPSANHTRSVRRPQLPFVWLSSKPEELASDRLDRKRVDVLNASLITRSICACADSRNSSLIGYSSFDASSVLGAGFMPSNTNWTIVSTTSGGEGRAVRLTCRCY